MKNKLKGNYCTTPNFCVDNFVVRIYYPVNKKLAMWTFFSQCSYTKSTKISSHKMFPNPFSTNISYCKNMFYSTSISHNILLCKAKTVIQQNCKQYIVQYKIKSRRQLLDGRLRPRPNFAFVVGVNLDHTSVVKIFQQVIFLIFDHLPLPV